MKKMLILLLVLGLTSVVNATISLEIREADGTTPADKDNLLLGSNYVAVISSSAAVATTGGLYGPGYAASDWDNLGPVNSTATVLDTGNLSKIYWYGAYNGYEYIYDDLMGPGISVGDAFTVDLTAQALGGFQLDLLDYSVSLGTPIQSITGTVVAIPEPITIALLGLGGLFLRRRK